jgi:hypothetical protein
VASGSGNGSSGPPEPGELGEGSGRVGRVRSGLLGRGLLVEPVVPVDSDAVGPGVVLDGPLSPLEDDDDDDDPVDEDEDDPVEEDPVLLEVLGREGLLSGRPDDDEEPGVAVGAGCAGACRVALRGVSCLLEVVARGALAVERGRSVGLVPVEVAAGTGSSDDSSEAAGAPMP